jgi:hypothetical protein
MDMFRKGKIANIAQAAGIQNSSEFARLFVASQKAMAQAGKLEAKYGRGYVSEKNERKLREAQRNSREMRENLENFAARLEPESMGMFDARLGQIELSSERAKNWLVGLGSLAIVGGAVKTFLKMRSVAEAHKADPEAFAETVRDYLANNPIGAYGVIVAGFAMAVIGLVYKFKEMNAFNARGILLPPKTNGKSPLT